MSWNGAISAKNAKIRINTSTTTDVLEAAEWSVAEESSEIDDTNFEAGGFGTLTMGVNQATVNVKAFWNPTTNQHNSPLLLNPGATLADVKLYLNDTTGKSWTFPLLKITNIQENSVVREGIRLEFTAKSSGTYTRPT